MNEAGAPPAYAGLARRWAALGYEALLLVAGVLIASFALAPMVSPSAGTGQPLVVPPIAGRAISFLVLFALGAWFYAWSWSEGRRTLPMKTWNLALLDERGRPVSRRAALVRYVVAWLGPLLALAVFAALREQGLAALAWPIAALNWLAAFVDPDRQFLHDRIAGTRIVNA